MKIIEFLNCQPFGYDQSVAVTALIYGVFWFVVYNVYVLWHINGINAYNRTIKELPISISQTYYMIDVRWLFQMFMWSSLFSIVLIGQNILFGIAGLLFAIMTCNPSVNSGNIYFIPHMIGAIGAITLCIIGMGVSWSLWWFVFLTVAFLLPIVLLLRKDTHFIYYLELGSLVMFMLGATINLLKI